MPFNSTVMVSPLTGSTNRQWNAGLVLLGFFVALFSAGIGVGGGAILVPTLISVFHFEFKKARSTSLATIVPITLVGSISHFLLASESPPWEYYFLFIPTCMAGVLLGGKIAHKQKGTWFKFAFACFLIIASLRMLKIVDLPALVYGGLHEITWTHETLFIMSFGVLIGMTAAYLGVGCGLIIVPFYVIVVGLDIHAAILLSLTTMFFLCSSATIMHRSLHVLDWSTCRNLFFPALPGAMTGAVISSYLPSVLLKQVFGVFLGVMACMYFTQEIRHLAKHPKDNTLVARYQGDSGDGE